MIASATSTVPDPTSVTSEQSSSTRRVGKFTSADEIPKAEVQKAQESMARLYEQGVLNAFATEMADEDVPVFKPDAKTDEATFDDSGISKVSSAPQTSLLSNLTGTISNAASGTADWLKSTGKYAGTALGDATGGAIKGGLIVLGVRVTIDAASMLVDEFVTQAAGLCLAKDAATEASGLSGASWTPRWK